MRKPSAYRAWILNLSAFPKGIALFVAGVVGLSLGLATAIIGIGIPILAGTMGWCSARLEASRLEWRAWREGQKRPSVSHLFAKPSAEDEMAGSPWRRWGRMLLRPSHYTALLYAILQFPITIAVFVVSITIPTVVVGLMASPAVYKISSYLYDFTFFDDEVQRMLLPPLTPFQRSLVTGGVGFLLLLFVPALLRLCGALNSGFVSLFGGSVSEAYPEEEHMEAPRAEQHSAADWLTQAEAAISRFDAGEQRPPSTPPH